MSRASQKQKDGSEYWTDRGEPGPAPLREKPPEHRRVLVIGCGRDVLVADEQGIEPGAMRRRGALDHPPRSFARVFGVRVIARERDPNFHPVILVAGSASMRPEPGVQAKDQLRLRT